MPREMKPWKAANTAETEPEPTTLRSALSCIRSKFRYSEPSHHRAMRLHKV